MSLRGSAVPVTITESLSSDPVLGEEIEGLATGASVGVVDVGEGAGAGAGAVEGSTVWLGVACVLWVLCVAAVLLGGAEGASSAEAAGAPKPAVAARGSAMAMMARASTHRARE
ncbi:hypothetical protein D4765_08915 [Subtercola vilae]|uniref:Uncharacterized protein n=1 Tax=Subtercola vilae TaxID=2056433 RepID=A0A4T2C4K4_9MICO|nr:hypothetical protein D4765_08915 [Subtercola vilae]